MGGERENSGKRLTNSWQTDHWNLKSWQYQTLLSDSCCTKLTTIITQFSRCIGTQVFWKIGTEHVWINCSIPMIKSWPVNAEMMSLWFRLPRYETNRRLVLLGICQESQENVSQVLSHRHNTEGYCFSS